MFAPNLDNENALQFSRFDTEHMLSTVNHTIELEGQEWASVEHYVNASIAGNDRQAERIKNASSGQEAFNLNKPWYRSKKRGWKSMRLVYMTRAVYTLVQMYPDVKQYLLNTDDQKIAESSLYDHFWGVGRDWRGENMMGRVWMDVRQKLREVSASEDKDEI